MSEAEPGLLGGFVSGLATAGGATYGEVSSSLAGMHGGLVSCIADVPPRADGAALMSSRRPRGAAAPDSLATLRVAGVALIIGGLLWQPLLAFQNLSGLHERSATWQWSLD